jgi:hypothetical protein
VRRNALVEPCDVGEGDAPVDIEVSGNFEGNDGSILGRRSQGWREFTDGEVAVKCGDSIGITLNG